MRRTLIVIAALALVIAAAAIYFVFDPSQSGMFPRCVFLTLTGWQCPGCGSQRAIHALLHGDFAQAWHYNAGLLVAVPLLGATLVAEIKRTSWPRYYRIVCHSRVAWTVIVLLIVWWVLRNL